MDIFLSWYGNIGYAWIESTVAEAERKNSTEVIQNEKICLHPTHSMKWNPIVLQQIMNGIPKVKPPSLKNQIQNE